jgi:acyl-CoA reductase-like NAD-dependent aldehyde dehydrogenase
MGRLKVLKTYKIYIGGKFPRTESGRFYAPVNPKGEALGNICLSSRKDVRNAVVAARKAFGAWNERTAFNRSQILYRIAEMLEGRKEQFVEELVFQGLKNKRAEQEVELSIDRLIYYAGWCDKYQQVLGSVNPVSSSHFNFSNSEAVGVVGVLPDNSTSLLSLISTVAPIIAGGNTCVILASEDKPLCAVTFAEVLNSSDVPGGVVNILTGKRAELIKVLAEHMDVNAILNDTRQNDITQLLEESSIMNLKRIRTYDVDWEKNDSQHLYFISDFQEVKTTWHPIENIGGASSTY